MSTKFYKLFGSLAVSNVNILVYMYMKMKVCVYLYIKSSQKILNSSIVAVL